jgi:RimJ/RimL family protein N-acetyltransferase
VSVDGLRLVPFGPEHLDELAGWLEDPDLLRFTRVPEPVPPGFARTWHRRYVDRRAAGTGDAFAAVDADDRMLALGFAPTVDRAAREAELGYAVAPGARGRGIATWTLSAMTRWAFDSGVLRAYLYVDVDNHASNRVAAKVGYVREGVLRSLHLKGDLRSDTVLWSRLPSDP